MGDVEENQRGKENIGNKIAWSRGGAVGAIILGGWAQLRGPSKLKGNAEELSQLRKTCWT